MKKPTLEEIRQAEEELLMPVQEKQKIKLQRNKSGRPIITLERMDKTVVHTPTQHDFVNILQLCECTDWSWAGDSINNTTRFSSYFETYFGSTCIEVHNGILYDSENYYSNIEYTILSVQEFYSSQKITPQMLKEVNDYFRGKK